MKQYRYTINGHPYEVTIHSADEEMAEVEVNGHRYSVRLIDETASEPAKRISKRITKPTPDPEPAVAANEAPASVTPEVAPAAPAPESQPKRAAGGREVIAPLPGLIREVLVAEGDQVKKGQKIMILEAMKMENEINADSDGTITSLLVAKGDSVQGGDPLATIG